MLSLRSGCFFGLSQRKSLTAAASRGRDVCRAFDFLKLLYAEIDLTALCRGATTFSLMKKLAKNQERTMLPRSQPPHGPPFFHPSALWTVVGRG